MAVKKKKQTNNQIISRIDSLSQQQHNQGLSTAGETKHWAITFAQIALFIVYNKYS